jgi:hypothetical protein
MRLSCPKEANEIALQGEASISEDWNRKEKDEAWAYPRPFHLFWYLSNSTKRTALVVARVGRVAYAKL